MKLALKLGAIALATVSTPSLALTTFSTNFDSVVLPTGAYTILPNVEGWTATGGDGIEVQNHAAGDPYSETNLVELDSNNNSAMSRTITDAGHYKLSFFYSPRPGIAASSNGIDVLINGTSVFNVTGAGGGTTIWSPQLVDLKLAAGSTLTFAAIGTSDSLGGYLDNISLAGAVPEAATWAMMIAGFGFMGAASRRRRAVKVTFA